MEAQKKAKQPDFVARAALLFGSGTLTSRILGLIRDSLLFSIMPLDLKDAWLAAYRLPNFFRRLLGEGGLSVSFIPVFVSLQTQEQRAERTALVNGVFTLLMGLVTAICLLCFLFMEEIVTHWLSGPGFSSVPGKIEQTIEMAKVMVFFLFFITFFAYLMALLNGLRKFTLSGYAPLFLNIALIVGLYLYRNSPDLPIASSWALVIGGALQALFLVPAVYKHGVFPKLSRGLFHPAVKRVIYKFLPTILGVGILQILNIVNVYFASQLAPGAISYMYLGDRLLELPLSLIAVSIGTTLLPTLSQYWSQKEPGTFLTCLSRHMRLFHFLAIPSAFGLWFFGTDIIDVLFARGQFTSSEVPVVAGILKVYCLTLLSAGGLKIISQAFYATGDTHTPAIVSGVSLVGHLFAAPVLMNAYGIEGLVLSTALVTLVNLVVCTALLQGKVGWLAWPELVGHALRCTLAGSAMAAFLILIHQVSWKQGRFLFDFPILLGLIAIASLIYFAMASLLRIDEMQVFVRRLKRRRT